MKVLIVAALVAMTLAAPSLSPTDDGRARFVFDSHPEQAFGLEFRGELDPLDETQTKISTFLRLF